MASNTLLGDEILWALGPEARARTVGLSGLVDDPLYSPVAGRWPASVPRLGPSVEHLVSLRPDAVVVASFSDPAYLAALEGLGKASPTVVQLESFGSFEAFHSQLLAVGEAVRAEPAAQALWEGFEARRQSLEAKRADRPWPSCLAWSDGYVPGEGTTFDAVAQTAGCTNRAAAEGLKGHVKVAREQVIAWSPDFVLIACGRESCEASRAAFAAEPGWAALPAVRNDQLVLAPAAEAAAVGFGMLDLAERLQRALQEEG